MNCRTRLLFGFRHTCLIVVVVVATLIQFGDSSGYQQQSSMRSNEESESSPANYMFKYAVQAGQYNNDFGHEEERNGKQTRGQYRVKLPDGRVQIVTYTADANGYKADVTYQGEAQTAGFGSGGGGGATGSRRSSPSDSYGASSNNNNNGGGSGGYGNSPAPSRKQTTPPQQGQSQSLYGVPSSSTASGRSTSSGSGSYMMQTRKINGQTYSFETQY